MKTSSEHWQGELDVDAVTLPEGEAGGPKERLTAERLDRIATYFAAPEAVRAVWGGPKDVAELARDVGCRVRSVHLWQKNPKMLERVREMTEMAATYAMPNILYGQMILSTPDIQQREDGSFIVIGGDTKAANFVATIGKFIRQGGGVNVSQTNFSPSDAKEAGMTQEEFEKRLLNAAAQIEEMRGEEED